MTLKSKGWGLLLVLKKPVKSQAISHSSLSQPQAMFPPGKEQSCLSFQPLHIPFTPQYNCRRNLHEGSHEGRARSSWEMQISDTPGTPHTWLLHKQHHQYPSDHHWELGKGPASFSWDRTSPPLPKAG